MERYQRTETTVYADRKHTITEQRETEGTAEAVFRVLGPVVVAVVQGGVFLAVEVGIPCAIWLWRHVGVRGFAYLLWLAFTVCRWGLVVEKQLGGSATRPPQALFYWRVDERKLLSDGSDGA